MNNKTEKKNRKSGAKKMSIAKIKKNNDKDLLINNKIELKKKIDTKINENSLKIKKELDSLKNKTSKKKDKEGEKKDKKNEDEINFVSETNEEEKNEDKLFCESLSECSSRLLKMIGYYSLTDKLKEKINSSIVNLSYLLKFSFIESIKLCITIFGIISFSVPKLENIYKYTKDKSNEFYNYLPSISNITSNLTSKLVSNISSLQDIDPKDILNRIKEFIMNNKMLLSISTILLIIISLKVCSSFKNNNTENYTLNENFSDILKKYLYIFPFTTHIGKIVIEYTGIFMDNAKDIVNGIINKIASICKYNETNKKILEIFEDKNKKIYSFQNHNEYVEHQLIPINYLTRYCVNKDGIFLYHSTGSGKSLTALGIAQNLGLPIILICPSIIINQWKVDYIERYKETIPNTEIYSYEDSYNILENKDKKWFNTHTLILDEAHNLIDLDYKLKEKYIILLMKFKKRIVLTATPIYTEITDISAPINIAQGTFILPNDKVAFKNKYFKLMKGKSILMGWIIPITQLSAQLLSIVFYSPFFELLLKKVKLGDFFIDKFKDMIGIFKKVSSLGNISEMFLYLVKHSSLIDKIINHLKKSITKENSKSYYKDSDKIYNYKNYIDRLRFWKYPDTSASYYNEDWDLKENVIEPINELNSLIPFFNIFSMMIFSFAVSSYYSNSDLNNGVEEYYEPNYELLSNSIGTSLSYYNLNDKSTKKLFPKVINTTFEIPLNNFQIQSLKYYIYNKMGIIQYSQLGIIENDNVYNSINFDQKNSENFKKYGGFIGNISLIKMNNSDNFVNPYDSILEISINNTYKLKKNYLFKEVSNKFIKIKELINSKKYKRITIYSNQSKAIKFLSSYLNSINKKHLLINNENQNKNSVIRTKILEQYYNNNDNPNILLLDSNYYEGISILKTDAFIIMEASLDLSKYTQLMGRCVRLDSHAPGGKIEIITLISTINKLNDYYETINYWLNENTHSIYTQFKSLHSNQITPDKLNNEIIKNLKKTETTFLKNITKKTIEYEVLNKNFKKCYKTDCELETIDKKSECGEINKNIIENKYNEVEEELNQDSDE